MTALFGKLENMLHNSLYVNFLLTGLVAQLACYPQPLLRSFLLNTNMVFQPSVKSLLQVPGPGGAVLNASQASSAACGVVVWFLNWWETELRRCQRANSPKNAYQYGDRCFIFAYFYIYIHITYLYEFIYKKRTSARGWW